MTKVSKRIVPATLNANDASLELQHRHAGTPGEGPLLVADQDFAGANRLLSELEISSVTVLPAPRKTGLSEIEKGLLADKVVARRTIVGLLLGRSGFCVCFDVNLDIDIGCR